ncbi:hypothetical protein ACQW02_02550 [Humitalea sp. 24SJ18S-53]|uniref:hypothetical protein n=1 Tax=Humitalea sp. 24SJ18S-53 TaxID=3422307 RepID=UPI003D671FD1
MTEVAETMEAVSRPVRHGVNNLMMVLLGNLDLILRGAAEGSAVARQAGRAKEAADRLTALLSGFLAMPRDPGVTPSKPGVALAALLPLLDVVAGRSVRLEDEALPPVVWARPEMALALLGWALEMSGPDIVPVLRLTPDPSGGAGLTPHPTPRASTPQFAAAAAACGGTWDGTVLVLPYAP